MLFQYKALLNNQKIEGEMDATSQREISEYLKSNGYFPISIIAKKTSNLSRFSSILDRVSQMDITFITRQFAIMLDAGLTLIDSLDIINKQVTKVPLKKMLDDIERQIRDGKTFSQTLLKFPHQFSHLYIALVRSGEASGKIDVVLAKLAEHLEREREFQQKIRNALIYPVIIIIVMFSLLFVMFSFVLPQLVKLYENFQIELPQITQMVILITNFMEKSWIFVLLGIFGILAVLFQFFKSVRGRNFYDNTVLKVPVIGRIIKISALVDVTRTLSILISSGVPILDGLVIVTDVNSNIVFRNAFKRITQKVEKGFSVGSAMSNEKIFPESLVQMVMVGEQTGHLDDTLMKLAEYYQTESEMAVKGMLALLEPSIIVFLGLTVGSIIMAIITPIFSITQQF